MSATISSNDGKSSNSKPLGQKKGRTFIKTSTEKKIAEDEFMAAAIGDVEWLRQSVRGNRGIINYDKNGLSPIHLSAIHGRVENLKLLIEKFKGDVDLASSTGWRPLHLAISNQTGKRSFICLQYLLGKGADPSIENDDGLMPMHQAASEGHVQCLKALIEVGARIDGVDSRGHKPIDLAKLWGHKKCARILAAETWHREKDFVAREMKQLQKVKMQEVLQEIERDEELKASQQFYGAHAFNDWLEEKGLPNVVEGSKEDSKPGQQLLMRPNSMGRPGASGTNLSPSPQTPPSTAGHRSALDTRENLRNKSRITEEDENTEGNEEKSSVEFNPAPLPPTYSNPIRWNKSTFVPKSTHISKLPDHYPRDEYTMLPKYAPMKGGLEPPQAKMDAMRGDVDMRKPQRIPELPQEVLQAVLDGGIRERPVVFKCRTILDVVQRKHAGVTKPRDEAGIHLTNDMDSFIFKTSMQKQRLLSSCSSSTSSSSPSRKSSKSLSATNIPLDATTLASLMTRLHKPTHFPNSHGQEYDLNLGQVAGI